MNLYAAFIFVVVKLTLHFVVSLCLAYYDQSATRNKLGLHFVYMLNAITLSKDHLLIANTLFYCIQLHYMHTLLWKLILKLPLYGFKTFSAIFKC